MLAEPIFLSLQWEWPNTWLPSIFIRFFGCNKCCKWCDSLYAVNDPESTTNPSIENIVIRLKCKNIVFTGWEPALFENIIEQIQSKLWRSYTYEIETNWSIPLRLKYNQINISPKLSNSGNPPYDIKALENQNQRKYCYKFVMKGEEDIKDIEECIYKYKINKNKIYIMPMWTDKDSQINQEVLNYCIKKWYRYCQRTHIILFGNKKGV